MMIKKIGSNITELHKRDSTVLFSYNTPVPFTWTATGVLVSNEKYNNTTKRHIKIWLSGRTYTCVNQTTIDLYAED
jgi:hypothetical protein